MQNNVIWKCRDYSGIGHGRKGWRRGGNPLLDSEFNPLEALTASILCVIRDGTRILTNDLYIHRTL